MRVHADRSPTRRLTGLASAAAALLLVALGTPRDAKAQIISPGKLAAPHAELEGIRNCTQCHKLRQPGVAPELCLECHRPLAERLAVDRGFHSTVAEEDCASCHKEHVGRDFQLVRLDTLGFDHSRTGFDLEGGHADPSCRSCHRSSMIEDVAVRMFKGEHGALDRTYLGLPTECASCHEDDDPHMGQFGERECAVCHDVEDWKEAPGFDHDRSVFPLTGRHRQVECGDCHVSRAIADGSISTRYLPTPHEGCATCHEDLHGGAMPGTCDGCHSTAGWRSIDRGRVERDFDHRTTGFLLEGRHAAAPCAACHDPAERHPSAALDVRLKAGTEGRAFPTPLADDCLSCHVDRHAGVFEESDAGAGCERCHGQEGWLPAAFDLVRHDRESAFALEGAHRTLPCADCHRRADPDLFEVRLGLPTCIQCHQDDDPHRNQFPGRGCESCHTDDSFRVTAFDHSGTRFPLHGAHGGLTCSECHAAEVPLDGGKTFVRYVPLGTRCIDCHGSPS